MHMRSIFALASIVAIAACDASANPQLAGLNGPGAGSGGNINLPPLAISPAVVSLVPGTTIQLFTNALPANQNQVQWNSLNPTIATVSQTGLVKAIGTGVTTVVARYSFDTTNVATATVMVQGPVQVPNGGMASGSRSP
ncbi:MAG TPA: Ig-like domain-containing protein [Gemmatimonadaceae bacterium]|jgi:Big-like domain-containing protein|nr:Ig-like domain-containing protein [Gemmatimonadaceae bacterium]